MIRRSSYKCTIRQIITTPPFHRFPFSSRDIRETLTLLNFDPLKSLIFHSNSVPGYWFQLPHLNRGQLTNKLFLKPIVLQIHFLN